MEVGEEAKEEVGGEAKEEVGVGGGANVESEVGRVEVEVGGWGKVGVNAGVQAGLRARLRDEFSSIEVGQKSEGAFSIVFVVVVVVAVVGVESVIVIDVVVAVGVNIAAIVVVFTLGTTMPESLVGIPSRFCDDQYQISHPKKKILLICQIASKFDLE